jgi:hypothetical protein
MITTMPDQVTRIITTEATNRRYRLIESELAITSNILLNNYEKCVKQEFLV